MLKKMKKTTIKDIAERVGVSIATISRILNYDDTFVVSEELKKKVFKIAEELNYKPRKYKRKKTKNNFLIVKTYSDKIETEDIYYLSLRLNLEKTLKKNHIKYKYLNEEENIGDKEKFEGIIIIGPIPSEKINDYKSFSHNILLLDSYIEDPSINCVTVNMKEAVQEVINYLISLGHKKIGLISAKSSTSMEDIREHYFIKYTKKLEIYDPNLIKYGDYTPLGGYKATKDILNYDYIPTAIFVINDSMAIGAYRAILEKGLKIPKDISIIGFNNISISQFLNPPLTTVDVPINEIVETGINLLIDNIEKKSDVTKKVLISPHLIIRGSCLNLKY